MQRIRASLLSINVLSVLSVWVPVVLLLMTPPANASDLEKEKRWADQIVDALMDGEAEYLNDGANDFLTLVTESSEGESEYGAVVMHGSGVHPNWPSVIQPLRVGLTEQGWHTISIQLPILANDASHDEYTEVFPEAPARIDAAIDYLKQNLNVKRVVLIAHSLGSSMTTYHLSENKPAVDGFVAIGMGPGGEQASRQTLKQLETISLPMLDIYGAEDLPAVVNSAAARKASQVHNPEYKQFVLPGADHFFDGEEDALLNHVGHWLTKQMTAWQ